MEKEVLTLHLAEPWYSAIVSASRWINTKEKRSSFSRTTTALLGCTYDNPPLKLLNLIIVEWSAGHRTPFQPTT